MIFRRGLKEQLVRVASRFAMGGLICLLAAMASAVELVVCVVVGPIPAPMFQRRRFPRR